MGVPFVRGGCCDSGLNGGSAVWTPTVSAVTGTNVDIGDFTSMSGGFILVGSTVMFSFEGTVNTTGWTSGTATIDLPHTGTLVGSVRAVVTCYAPANFTELYLTNAAGNTAMRLNFTAAVPGPNMFIYASGSYEM